MGTNIIKQACKQTDATPNVKAGTLATDETKQEEEIYIAPH